MPLVTAAVRGDLRAAMEAAVREAAHAMRRGVERAGREVQAEIRAQPRAASFTWCCRPRSSSKPSGRSAWTGHCPAKRLGRP